MASLTVDQAKKLCPKLVKLAKAKKEDEPAFLDGLAKHKAYLEKQRAEGKQQRGGKHTKILCPLMAALLPSQRASGLVKDAPVKDFSDGGPESTSNKTEGVGCKSAFQQEEVHHRGRSPSGDFRATFKGSVRIAAAWRRRYKLYKTSA